MKRGLSRRLVLRSAGGIAVTLPFLPSIARADTMPPPKRFVGFYMPNGVYPAWWWPTVGPGGETDFTFAQSLASLADVKSHVLQVGGLDMKVALTGPGEQHQRGLGGLLTGTTLQSGTFVGNDGSTAGWANGPSVDQELISLVGAGSKMRSLQLGVKCTERDVSGSLSYSGAAAPLLPQNNPELTFRSLFSSMSMPDTEAAAIRRRRGSVLDAVLEQLSSTRNKLSVAERPLLDNHLTFVRDLETRVTGLPPSTFSCVEPSAPPTTQYDTAAAMNEVSRLQLDLLVLAFKCDATRVATIVYSDAKNHTPLPFINVNGDVHNISHLSDQDAQRADLGKRDTWQIEQFGYLLRRLLETAEGDSNLLQSTLMFMGTDVSKGNTHAHDDMPFLLAGHAAGFRMGRFVRFGGQAHNDLLLSILQGYGGTHSTFGDARFCTGPLAKMT